MQWDAVDVRSIQRDGPLRRLVETTEQLDERGLPRAVQSNDGQLLLRPELEVDLPEYIPVCPGVSEPDVLKPEDEWFVCFD